MPKVKAKSKSAVYESLRKEGAAIGEKRDCSVIAVAVSCGVSYDAARKMLAKHGRPEGKGAYTESILKSIRAFGKTATRIEMERFIHRYPEPHRRVLKSVTSHHPARFNPVWKDGKTYVMFTARHVFAVVDGQNHDWSVDRALRAYAIYEVK